MTKYDEPVRPIGETLRDLELQLAVAECRKYAKQARMAALYCHVAAVIACMLGMVLVWGIVG